MEKYLTSEQVASILQVHQFTVLKYLKNGTLEGVKMGRVYRIKESDVEKFLNDMTVGNGKKRVPASKKPENQVSLPPSSPKSTPIPTKEEAHNIEFQDDKDNQNDPYYKII